MQTASRKVGEFLVNRKVLSKDALEYALAKETDTGVPLAKILSTEGLVSERDLVAAVADQLNLPFWDPTTTPVSPLVDSAIPADVARKHMVVGLALEGDSLLVATDNPLDEAALTRGQPGDGLEGQALLGDPVRHHRGAISAMYGPNPATSAASFGGGLDEPSPAAREPDAGAARRVQGLGPPLDLWFTAHDPCRWRSPADRGFRGPDRRPRCATSSTTSCRRGSGTRFEDELELDTSHVVPGVGRFRVNVFQQRDSVGAVFRAIPFEIMSLDELGIPPPGPPVRRTCPVAWCW